MPRALSLALRKQIILLHQQHQPCTSICLQVQVSLNCVRRLLRRYKADPALNLEPAYQHCGSHKPTSEPELLRAGLWLKRLHPLWGAPLIFFYLKEHFKEQLVPAVRTLQRWFRKKGLNAPHEHRPPAISGTAKAPHNIWQVDAKERLQLSSGEAACYLTIADEHSGACLAALVFPLQPYLAGTLAALEGAFMPGV